MKLTRSLMGRGRRRPAIALEPLCGWISRAVPRRESAVIEPELVRARLADRYRDAGLAPLSPARFDELAAGLDDPSWRRLALAVDALDLETITAALPSILQAPVETQVREAFIEFADSRNLLTLDLLRQSPLRVEEFARGWLARLGVAIEGEAAAQSEAQLERLDYGRLLHETEQAKEAAEERLAALRKIQDEQARKARRGKW